VGLVEFPGSSIKGKGVLENPKILKQEEGIPSVDLTGMAGDESNLWLAYGGEGKESGLGLYEPKRRVWETVLCSAIKGESPFNAGLPYELCELSLTHGRKLFFKALVWGAGSKSITTQWRGLWKIDTNTRDIKKIWYDKKGASIVWLILGSIEDSGQKLWCKAPQSLIQFDPSSEKSKFILGSRRVLKRAHGELNLTSDVFIPYWKRLPCGPYLVGSLDLSTCAVQGDRLWARLGESQLIILHKGKGFEEAEIIDNNILNGDKVLRFFSTPYGLIALGEGTVGLIETRNNEK
ncbi:hypothetical protein KA005_82205, partial [bacterium]|nr:hypothetical protein [bacterium]